MTRRLLFSALAALPFFRPAKAAAVKPVVYYFTEYRDGDAVRLLVWTEAMWAAIPKRLRKHIRLASFTARIEGDSWPLMRAFGRAEDQAVTYLRKLHGISRETKGVFKGQYMRPEEAFGKERV